MLSTIIAAIITGIGGLFFIWWSKKQAAEDKARADSLESDAKGEVQANKTEGVLLDERDKKDADKVDNPTDWRGS